MVCMKAQGATEYLVLLAVVLIVALVSVALLGFFPGMASDSQRQQSEMYWRGAQPISITEWAAELWTGDSTTFPYLRIRNSGAYPVRITGIVGADNAKITVFYTGASCGISPAGYYNMSDYFYLSPGEEKYFGFSSIHAGLTCDREVVMRIGTSAGYYIGGATSVCANSNSTPGTMVMPSMGFEYIEYIDNQQITKRQIGKQVIIKCLPPG